MQVSSASLVFPTLVSLAAPQPVLASDPPLPLGSCAGTTRRQTSLLQMYDALLMSEVFLPREMKEDEEGDIAA